MSLYNMIQGMNPHSGLILAALELGPQDFDRFRDARVAGGEIAIYTRVGGPNRGDHEVVYDYMATHPNYLRVEDASHDSTYATFFFSIPEAHRELLDTINALEPFDPAMEFEQMMDNLKKWDGKSRAPVANPDGVTKLMGDIGEKLGGVLKR